MPRCQPALLDTESPTLETSTGKWCRLRSGYAQVWGINRRPFASPFSLSGRMAGESQAGIMAFPTILRPVLSPFIRAAPSSRVPYLWVLLAGWSPRRGRGAGAGVVAPVGLHEHGVDLLEIDGIDAVAHSFDEPLNTKGRSGINRAGPGIGRI